MNAIAPVTTPSIYEHPLFQAQVQLEEDMLVDAKAAFWSDVLKARSSKTESTTEHGIHIIRSAIDPVAAGIREMLDTKPKKGRPPASHRYLREFDADVAAYIALKTILDCISVQEPLTSVAVAIGERLEDEARLTEFKKHDFSKFKLTQERLQSQSVIHRDRRKTVMRLMANRAGTEHATWPERDKMLMGVALLDIIIRKTNLVRREDVKKGARTTSYIVATQEAIEFVTKLTAKYEVAFPRYLPTIIAPKRWTTPFNGGYWSGLARRIRLVKTRNSSILDDMKGMDLRDVYASINAVQETAWRVNRKVQDVLDEALERGALVGGLPAVEPTELPPKPGDIDTNPEALRKWKKAAGLVHSSNRKEVSKRLQVVQTNRIAKRFLNYEAIYFPHQFDFRGRMYAIPMFLNPQGPDYAKALLQFAAGKPIENSTAAGWLAIHGANLYGNDKVSLEDRIGWVHANEDSILAVAADPWASLDFWTAADSPWQFLAFCFDWAGFQAVGYGYTSCLPVALDGSCNGLQHYSAALRDSVGAAATNLIPASHPADIYAEVANVAKAKLCLYRSASGSDPGSEAWFATKWMEMGITRKITKRAVMTLPYGSTVFSCREFIEQALREQLTGKPSPFAHRKMLSSGEWIDSDGIFEASLFLQPLVWAAIGEVVHAARAAMDWLKACAKLAASENRPVDWITPDGFKVRQQYNDIAIRRVETILDGRIVKLSIASQTDKIDVRRMANGIAPNYVHSLDGTALRQFVVYASENGINSFGLVHDSYATVAADVELMGACLRSAFVDLYKNHDVLEEFRTHILAMLPETKQVKLPAVPEKGELEIESVLQSDFFFA